MREEEGGGGAAAAGDTVNKAAWLCRPRIRKISRTRRRGYRGDGNGWFTGTCLIPSTRHTRTSKVDAAARKLRLEGSFRDFFALPRPRVCEEMAHISQVRIGQLE